MCDSCCATCRQSGFCIPSPPPPPPPPPPQAQSVCTLAELRTALEYVRHYSRIILTCDLTGLTEADAITFHRGGAAGEQDLEIVGQCGPSGQDQCEIVGDGNAPTIVAEGQQFNKGPLLKVTVDHACMPDKGDGRQGICTRGEVPSYSQVTFRNLVFKKGQGFIINGRLHVDFFNCDFIQLAKERQGGAIALGQMRYWQAPTTWYPNWSLVTGFPPRVRAAYAQFTGNKAYLTRCVPHPPTDRPPPGRGILLPATDPDDPKPHGGERRGHLRPLEMLDAPAGRDVLRQQRPDAPGGGQLHPAQLRPERLHRGGVRRAGHHLRLPGLQHPSGLIRHRGEVSSLNDGAEAAPGRAHGADAPD